MEWKAYSAAVARVTPEHIQLFHKKETHSYTSNYSPIALTSCPSKASEFIFNIKILKHISYRNLLSDHQYGFRKGRSTGDLLAFLTNAWLSRDFGETSAVALDISKTFDRVWHKALISKLPSNGFYLSLCTLILSFLSVASVVDCHCSSSKPINSCVPQGVCPTTYFLSSVIFSTYRPIHSYTDDSTLPYWMSFTSRPSLQELNTWGRDARDRLTSDLFEIIEWGRANFC